MATDPISTNPMLTGGASRAVVRMRWGRGRQFFRGKWRRSAAGFFTSLAFHASLLVALALWLIPFSPRGPEAVDVGFVEAGDLGELDGTSMAVRLQNISPVDTGSALSEPTIRMAGEAPEPEPMEVLATGGAVQGGRPLDPKWRRELMRSVVPAEGGGWSGRKAGRRAALLAEGGGNGITEGAVEVGLEWLVRHQHENGSWSFDLSSDPCAGRCRHSSSLDNATGATGLALLCFLGRDHTHTNGNPYRDTVHKGVYFLVRSIHPTPHGGDLQQGTMYAHGIATLALCEAYGMTRDPALRDAAQSAVDFICHAQHPRGGWRYSPGQPGDTTVFGWQLMALKSASLAGLRVPSEVRVRARAFLDSVQTKEGSFYGYLRRGKEPTPTSIGLLSRMYMGWPRARPALRRGTEYLAARGPSKHDMYFNYYATQVMFHYRSAGWTGWNHRLSNYLVRTQARTGHELGSWYFDDQYAREAGRHYVTCLAIMILEVYYRHLPLYHRDKLKRREF